MREKAINRNCVVEARIKKGKGKWRQYCYLQMDQPDFMEALQYFGMEHEVELTYPDHFILPEEQRDQLSVLGIHLFVRAAMSKANDDNIDKEYSQFEKEVLSRSCDVIYGQK